MTVNDGPFLRASILLALVGLFLFVTGCGEEESTSPKPDDLTEVNAYLGTLPTWEEFADVAEPEDAPVGELLANMEDNVLCTTTPYSITQNPEEIVTFGSAPNVLYLGSLIQGDTYMGGLGSMLELPIRQRSPLTIAVNLFSGTDITDVVENPDAASVQASLNRIISEASDSGHLSGNRIYYNKKETYSLHQATLKLGMSFKYMGVEAQHQLEYGASREKRTVTAYFKQIMYEAYIVPPQTPAQFFSSAFTKEKLDEQIALGNIGPGNLPVYVGKIQYGRMMMFTMTASSKVDSMKLAIEASLEGFGSYSQEVEASLRRILQSSEYTLVTIGGTQETALNMLRSGSLSDYFAGDDPLTSAVPLAYTLYNLADGSIATVSETTAYDVQECSSVSARCFLNRTEWENAAADLVGPGHTFELPTTAENIAQFSDEMSGTPPAPNTNMGPVLTFRSSSTQYPFTFSLTGEHGSLVFDDQESGGPGFGGDQERSISIGDINNAENDDFTIEIVEWDTNTAVFAIGITIGNNAASGGEGATAFGVNGFDSGMFPDSSPDCEPGTSFLGVVSTVPLMRLEFNEGSTGDDIFVRDFVFGVLEWTD